MFKKLAIIILFMLSGLGCEEIPNSTVDTESVDYIIQAISAPTEVIYSETPEITTTITIERSGTVEKVWFNITSIDGSSLISDRNEMLSNESVSKRTYFGQYSITNDVLPGMYEFSYYVEDAVNAEGENIKKVGTKQFRFLLEEDNVPPIISSINLYETTPQGSRIVVSMRVIDSNGPDDIKDVFFKLFDPNDKEIFYDEENSLLEFPLLDDGLDADERKNDGIYSRYLTFSEDAELGNWKFQFGARDQSDEECEQIELETTVTINYPPEIRNLVIPDNIDRGIEFVFSIEASDPNGLTDIYLVYFELVRPDGSVVYADEENEITAFRMFDNGDTEGSGDQIEEDGIYSLKNSFGEESQTGNWVFTFNAMDNAGTLSNTMTYTIKVN